MTLSANECKWIKQFHIWTRSVHSHFIFLFFYCFAVCDCVYFLFFYFCYTMSWHPLCVVVAVFIFHSSIKWYIFTHRTEEVNVSISILEKYCFFYDDKLKCHKHDNNNHLEQGMNNHLNGGSTHFKIWSVWITSVNRQMATTIAQKQQLCWYQLYYFITRFRVY